MNKTNKGITLIALVITIIVILILAGISITLVIGSNGIINRAQIAGQEIKEKQILEAWELLRGEGKLYEARGEEGLEEEHIKKKLEEVDINFANGDITWQEFKSGAIITIQDTQLRYSDLYTGKVTNTTLTVNISSEDNIVTDFKGSIITITNKDDNLDSYTYELQSGEKAHEFIQLKMGKQYVATINSLEQKYYILDTVSKNITAGIDKEIILEYDIKKLYLYNEGYNVDITGGWNKYFGQNTNTFESNASNLYMYTRGGGSVDGMLVVYSEKSIDMSNYTKLNFEYTYSITGNGAFRAGIYGTKTSSNSEVWNFTESCEKGIYSVDISRLESSQYVKFFLYGNPSGSCTLIITKVWLEK